MNNLHKNQRVAVFVDVQNMYYSAKNLYKTKVNFSNILKTAVSGRQIVRAFAYVIKADVSDENNFFDALENIGYEVNAKDLQIFYGGAKKGDWDVGIAMDIVRMSEKVDVIVLVSGDGDFKELLEYVQAKGCRAEVLAFGKSASSKLKESADSFIDMDKDLTRYLIRSNFRPMHRNGQPWNPGQKPGMVIQRETEDRSVEKVQPVVVEQTIKEPETKQIKPKTAMTRKKKIVRQKALKEIN